MQKFAIALIGALAVVGANGAALRAEEEGLQAWWDDAANWIDGAKNDVVDFFDKQVAQRAECIVKAAGPGFLDTVEPLEELLEVCQEHPTLEKYASQIISIKEDVEKIVNFIKRMTNGLKPTALQVTGVIKAGASMAFSVGMFTAVSIPQLMTLMDPNHVEKLQYVAEKFIDTMRKFGDIFDLMGSKIARCAA